MGTVLCHPRLDPVLIRFLWRIIRPYPHSRPALSCHTGFGVFQSHSRADCDMSEHLLFTQRKWQHTGMNKIGNKSSLGLFWALLSTPSMLVFHKQAFLCYEQPQHNANSFCEEENVCIPLFALCSVSLFYWFSLWCVTYYLILSILV